MVSNMEPELRWESDHQQGLRVSSSERPILRDSGSDPSGITGTQIYRYNPQPRPKIGSGERRLSDQREISRLSSPEDVRAIGWEEDQSPSNGSWGIWDGWFRVFRKSNRRSTESGARVYGSFRIPKGVQLVGMDEQSMGRLDSICPRSCVGRVRGSKTSPRRGKYFATIALVIALLFSVSALSSPTHYFDLNLEQLSNITI